MVATSQDMSHRVSLIHRMKHDDFPQGCRGKIYEIFNHFLELFEPKQFIIVQ